MPYESTFSYGDFTYEIHPGLVYRNENEVNLIREEKFFNAFREKTKDGKLDDAFHFLYVLQHVKGHFAYAGVGIRQFTDIAVLIRNDNGIDWEKVKKGLEETGLSDFAFASFFFIEKAFGIKAPISYPERDDDFFERSKDVIFRNGVFGFDNENNEAVFVSTIMRLENVGYKKAKFKNFMNQAFPGYDAMKGLYYVPYLNNRKFLLPIAWIHRFFYRSFCGKNRREFIKNTMVPKKTVEAKGAFLKEWGIQS